jgi:hypothetical protein
LHPLASTANIPLSPEWAESLTNFAEVFIEYQHSQRLLGYALHSDTEKFFKELDSASFNWRGAGRYPDWLLIQVRMTFLGYTELKSLTASTIARSKETS